MFSFSKLIILGGSIFLAASVQAQHTSEKSIKEFNGIAAAFRCSASIVSLGQKDSESAYVLSAGHCAADDPNAGIAPNKAIMQLNILNRDEYTSYYQQLGSNDPLTLGNFQLSTIIYSAMTKEDVTLFRAVPTVADLKGKGVRIFKIADKLPSIGQRLHLISGLWGQVQTCTVEKIIANNEVEKQLFGSSPSPIEMENTILLSKNCTGRGGWSGAPLLDLETGLVYGVSSRIYSPQPGSALAQSGVNPRILVSSLIEFRKCITSAGHLNLFNPGCRLPNRVR